MYVLQQGTYRIVRLKNYTNKKVVFGGLVRMRAPCVLTRNLSYLFILIKCSKESLLQKNV